MRSVLNCTGHDLLCPNAVDSDGPYVIDDKGKRDLHLESGVWRVPLGHKNRRVNAAMARQADASAHTSFLRFERYR